MLGKKLEELLKERNFRIADLARQTGIPVQTLYSIVNNDANRIDIDNLFSICHVLRIKPDALSSSPQTIDPILESLLRTYAQLSSRSRSDLLNYADSLLLIDPTRKNADAV